jgi:hypothetical protein
MNSPSARAVHQIRLVDFDQNSAFIKALNQLTHAAVAG